MKKPWVDILKPMDLQKTSKEAINPVVITQGTRKIDFYNPKTSQILAITPSTSRSPWCFLTTPPLVLLSPLYFIILNAYVDNLRDVQ